MLGVSNRKHFVEYIKYAVAMCVFETHLCARKKESLKKEKERKEQTKNKQINPQKPKQNHTKKQNKHKHTHTHTHTHTQNTPVNVSANQGGTIIKRNKTKLIKKHQRSKEIT